MADFAWVTEQGLWINLDYVVRVERDGDEAEATAVVFADGTRITLSRAAGKELARHLRPRKKKSKKKKKKETASDGTGGAVPPAAPAGV